MDDSAVRNRHSHLKGVALAMALMLPGAAAFAESMSSIVTTRADQTVTQQYGRDSVYAFSPGSKPFTPSQTGSRVSDYGNGYSSQTRERLEATAKDSSTPPEPHNGRTEGGRFDNPDGTRGQNESGG